MRVLRFAAGLALPLAMWAANPDYERGMKALGDKQYATALGYLEQALKADPDNIQFGSDYRQAALQQAKALHPKEGAPADFDRSIKFFETLTAANPNAWAAWLNYGFAYVDKIPAAGTITQVLLANTALSHFTKSIEAKPSWIAYYSRGNSYLYWPKIFGKAATGLADLEQAMKIQKADSKTRPFHVRAYMSLGDAYWKTDQMDKATATWKEGLTKFPDAKGLKDRLSKQGEELQKYLDDVLDPSKRVDTDLQEIWSNQ
jgi:tetratricopeptide (TPR) repeat protein